LPTLLALTLNNPEEFTISLGDNRELILGDILNIELSSSAPLNSISWPSEFSEFDDQRSISFLPIQNRTLSVTAIDIYGCSDNDSIRISIDKEVALYTPNAFSPNGDNINDDYFISTYGRSLAFVSEFVLYDRWGKELWGFDNKTNSLDPQDQILSNEVVNQIGLMPGVYTFKLSAVLIDNSVIEKTGTINLIL